jgi:large subunit GTPase 1
VEEELAGMAGVGGGMLTPFEKNLHVWRQLWRVVERSDVVVQIVDARNPLLYFCPDLYRYAVEEMGRTHVLVVNKADLLNSEMISRWERYFAEQGLEAVFFSAFKASVKEETDDARVLGAEELILKLHMFDHTLPITKADQRVTVGFIGYPNVGKSSTINCLLETAAAAETAMLEAEEALENGLRRGEFPGADGDGPPPGLYVASAANPLAGVAVGTIASTMNGFSSMTLKRVGVSSTPGKTKHFQTLVLSDRLLLCDCPGLVFPNFSASKSELICAGVLSIDSIRGNAIAPIALIARRIPAALLEGVYGIRFPASDGLGLMDVEDHETKPGHVSATTLLETHARARGFMTDHDRADHSRSARLLLKQYVAGRILFAHAPPPAGPDEGQPGVGPEVHAKKGALMRKREEAVANVAAGQESAAALAVADDAAETESVVSTASSRLGRDMLSSKALGLIGIAAGESSGGVTAKISRGKKNVPATFTRVERSYYPNPHG